MSVWDFSTLLYIALLVIGFAVSLLVHVHLTKSHLAIFWTCEEATEKTGPESNRSDHQRRLDEELLQTRLVLLKKVAAGLVHFVFLFGLATIWKFVHQCDVASAAQVLAACAAYGLLTLGPEKVKTEHHFRVLERISFLNHFVLAAGTACETDLVTFDIAEKLCTIGLISTSITLLNVEKILPFHLCQSIVLTCCRWKLIGFAHMTPFIAFASLIPPVIVAGVIPACVHNVRSNIAAKLDSGDASSLMLGFRHMLRGVCDGDFVLDRQMTIVDDASCLERVLKSSKKLLSSNFLDLFLDSDSRENFSKFLAAPAKSDCLPRGLRVKLQGANGSVSMDLFCTALRHPGSVMEGHCLIAMKEDPEAQSVPPEAAPGSAPQVPPSPAVRSRSSLSELVVAYNDLQEIALLVSDGTGFLDIEEAHLSFRRQSAVSNIESGMPNLRRFIRPFDWERIERIFGTVRGLPPSDERQRCYFNRHPTLFRVPGESRSYLCARTTSVEKAQRHAVAGAPMRFWMHLSHFDSCHILRPREQQLEGIEEET
eukprot:Skav233067  [mRNA]  locus=scaffold1468:116991:118607:- [translate_table: standard]